MAGKSLLDLPSRVWHHKSDLFIQIEVQVQERCLSLGPFGTQMLQREAERNFRD